MEIKWKPGDKVCLVSGGPIMAVQGIEKKKLVRCFWFDGKHLRHGDFAPESLESLTVELSEESRQAIIAAIAQRVAAEMVNAEIEEGGTAERME